MSIKSTLRLLLSSLLLVLSACQTSPHRFVEISPVMATAETEAVAHSDDAADDPAIWVNESNPAASRVLGTDKQGGLAVYDLQGQLLQFLPVGRINNIDLRKGFDLNGKIIDIAIATQRDKNALEVFAINPQTGTVSELAEWPTPANKIYGICMHKSPQGEFYAIPNDKDGRFFQYQLSVNKFHQLEAHLVREFSVATQPEGCVADDMNEQLYIGEEEHGVWTLSANPNNATKLSSVVKIGGAIKADIEGLALYQTDNENLLIISSQGNNRYVILEATAPFAIRAVIQVVDNPVANIDGTSETDGIEVTTANLGGHYSEGMLVVQDDDNTLPKQNQNFKFIPWSQISALLK